MPVEGRGRGTRYIVADNAVHYYEAKRITVLGVEGFLAPYRIRRYAEFLNSYSEYNFYYCAITP